MKVSITDWWILVVERNSLFSKSGLIKVGQKQIDRLSAVIKLVLYCWLTLKWESHAQKLIKNGMQSNHKYLNTHQHFEVTILNYKFLNQPQAYMCYKVKQIV